MTSPGKVAHNIGRRRVVERQQPRRSKRQQSEHVDRYADQRDDPSERDMSERLAALARHFNGEEGDRV